MPKNSDKPRANDPDQGQTHALPAVPAAPPMQATGQRRSLERGKATHKKNPGKRSNQGG